MSDPRTWAELLDDAKDGPEFARVLQALMASLAAASRDDNE